MMGLALIISNSLANPSGSIPDGYWRDASLDSEQERFIRIRDGKGFKCILDWKSSFRFTIIGDSMTTPMNGMDAIRWMPGSGDLVIMGEEKGEPYSERYTDVDSVIYAHKCGHEESRLTPSGLRTERSDPHARAGKPSRMNALGRKVREGRMAVPGFHIRKP